MTLREEFKEFQPIFKSFMKPLFKAGVLFQSGAILEAISETFFKRKMFPEPLDFPSHIGNFREAAIVTVGSYAMIGLFTMLEPLVDRSHELFRRGAQKAAVNAFAVSSAVQVIGEKFEYTNIVVAGGNNTGDPLDAAYGIVWSGVTAAAAYRMTTKLEQDRALWEQDQAPYLPEPDQAPLG